jgi:hypothetical protein
VVPRRKAGRGDKWVEGSRLEGEGTAVAEGGEDAGGCRRHMERAEVEGLEWESRRRDQEHGKQWLTFETFPDEEEERCRGRPHRRPVDRTHCDGSRAPQCHQRSGERCGGSVTLSSTTFNLMRRRRGRTTYRKFRLMRVRRRLPGRVLCAEHGVTVLCRLSTCSISPALEHGGSPISERSRRPWSFKEHHSRLHCRW